jgi:hypothetical protein
MMQSIDKLTSCTSLNILLLSVDPGYLQAAFLCGGNPRIKKRQDRGTPTQLTCRGAPCGYPQIYAFTSPYVLVQDMSKAN